MRLLGFPTHHHHSVSKKKVQTVLHLTTGREKIQRQNCCQNLVKLRQLPIDATEKILVSTETKKRLSEDRIRIEEDTIALKQLDPNSDEAKEFLQLKRQEYLMRDKKRLSM